MNKMRSYEYGGDIQEDMFDDSNTPTEKVGGFKDSMFIDFLNGFQVRPFWRRQPFSRPP